MIAVVNTGITQTFNDVLQNRFAPDFDHRFRQIRRQLAHSRAATGREQDCFINFHDNCKGGSASPKTMLKFTRLRRHYLTSP